ncbi:MAG: hypothetical protein R3Y63_00975 [Eubacteriales bacterium]
MKTILVCLFLLLLLLLILLLLPVGILAKYGKDGVQVYATLWKKTFPLFSETKEEERNPKKDRAKSGVKKENQVKKKESKEENKKNEKKEKQSSGNQKKKQQGKAPTLTEKITLVKSFVPLVIATLAKLGRYKKIDSLELLLRVGDEDPVKATILYGQAHALLGTIWRPLDTALNIQQGRASVQLQYERTEIEFQGRLAVSITIGQLLYLIIYFLLEARKLLATETTPAHSSKNKQ